MTFIFFKMIKTTNQYVSLKWENSRSCVHLSRRWNLSARVTRSHEFEVGALKVIVEGSDFGTKDNGNMDTWMETWDMLMICCMKFVDYPSFFDGSAWIGHMICSAMLECARGNQHDRNRNWMNWVFLYHSYLLINNIQLDELAFT